MKKIWMMMAMVAVFTACSNEEDFDSQAGNYTLTGYADVESRTTFGTPGSNSIPFVWSASDYIYAGNTKSNSIVNGGSAATFTFASNPSATDVYYNIAGTSAKQAHVKAEQTVGNLGANGDFGYGTISNGSFTLSHATAYMWFNITALPQGATLESITLDASTVIAGKATWNGSEFGAISNGSNTISLNVNKASVSGAETAMVVFPVAIESASVTYRLNIAGKTKYYKQTLGAKTFVQGTTYKVSVNLATVELYELRVLTFEDADAKFSSYELEYFNNKQITNWSDLIAEDQYGDYILGYGAWMGDCIPTDQSHYYWYDENNTFLAHNFPYNYDSYCFAGGGHAISNYASNNYSQHGDYTFQLTVYDKDANGLIREGGGHNGSDNFAMHYGYYDGSEWNQTTEDDLPAIYFKDDKARIIDHLWVCLSTYEYYCLYEGNGLTAPLGEGDYVIIEAIGHKEDGTTSKISIRVADLQNGVIDNWSKWDLSALGKVKKVHFNIIGTNDNGYGFSQPAYFAYDDVAVQFTE